jgi:hypothetical protein
MADYHNSNQTSIMRTSYMLLKFLFEVYSCVQELVAGASPVKVHVVSAVSRCLKTTIFLLQSCCLLCQQQGSFTTNACERQVDQVAAGAYIQ